jgi:nesprin-1
MSELGAHVNEFGDVQRQKDSIAKWIETTENSVAEYLKRPCKLRPDASQMEINMITDLQQTMVEKQAALDDICQKDGIDHDLKIALATLEGHITMLLDSRYSQQSTIEEFRFAHQECQAWFEKVSRSLTELDEAQDMTSDERLAKLQEVIAMSEANTNKPAELADKAKFVLQEVGEMDKQQVNEQTRSVERRMTDLKKRIDRKNQILDIARTGYVNTKAEIEEMEAWLTGFYDEIKKVALVADIKDRITESRSKVKDVDSKMMAIETLENKIDTISSDLQATEFEELKQKLATLIDEQKKLAVFAKSDLATLTESSDFQKKFGNEFSEVQNWLKAKTTEFVKAGEYEPLKAYSMEKKIARGKKDLSEIGDYEESRISQVKLGIISLQKSSDKSMKEKVEKDAEEMEDSLRTLKDHIRNRITYLEENLDFRREFEAEFDKCVQWLDQADTIITTEVRGTINIAILDDHHHKFQKLKRDEEENRKRVTDVFMKANQVLPKLSDADRISLQTQMDDVCDKQNHVTDTVNAKIDNLVKNIDVYKNTAQKIEDSVNHLTEIQRQIRLLNKPIGYRVEDAEDVLDAYETILNNLKDFKVQMEDLQKTAGTNVNELKALLTQQEELIGAIENQMLKIRNLISVRHQFMTMITGITSFIIKHTEVVKEIERSNIPSMDKVRKFDDSVARLKDCETQLSLASDKGQQIANEGSTADRNQITQQLQALKTQILTLKRAIEKKRDEHIKSVAEHNKIFGELEAHLDWLQEKEAEVKSQPLLSTTVADVDSHLVGQNDLSKAVMDYVERIKLINDQARKEVDLPPRIFEMLSTASALSQELPRELAERAAYLETQKNYRLQYDSLVERLNNWVEEAQVKLRPSGDSGYDFDNLAENLDEHKQYFSEETRLRELLHSIHDTANKIWASLGEVDQDKISHEQEFLTQLVKNTLNCAHSRQGEFEEQVRVWTTYQETVERVQNMLEEIEFEPETPSSLASVKTSIQKVDNQIKTIMSKKPDFDVLMAESKKIESQADTINRQQIAEEALGLKQDWQNLLAEAKEHKEMLATLALQWEDFDTKYKQFDSQLATYHQQASAVESTFTSIRQMNEIKRSLKVTVVFCLAQFDI